MRSHFTFGAHTGIQPRYQQGTDEGTLPGRRIHLGLPSDFPVSDREHKRTSIIGHVDYEIRDPRRCKLLDRSIDIRLELTNVPFERANKHLRPERILLGRKRKGLQDHERRLSSLRAR